MDKTSFSFVYKDENITFITEELINGYPRFNVHERRKTATSNNRSTNYFVGEYLAYQVTENMQFTQSNDVIPKFNTTLLKASKERIIDTQVENT